MSDYGLQVTKSGVSAPSSNPADLIMTTKFPFANIDPTLSNSFRTTNISISRDPVIGVTTLLTYFAHGYTYIPKVWGLWTVGPYVAGTFPFGIVNVQSYNTYLSNTTAANFQLSYTVDATNVSLYIVNNDPSATPFTLVGVNIQFTSLVFVTDLQAQNYL